LNLYLRNLNRLIHYFPVDVIDPTDTIIDRLSGFTFKEVTFKNLSAQLSVKPEFEGYNMVDVFNDESVETCKIVFYF
jgi:hypothetical protein